LFLIDDINFICNNETILQNQINIIFFQSLFSFVLFIFKNIVVYITTSWFLLILIAFRESSKIVNYRHESKKICAVFLQPTPLYKTHDKYATITLLYTLYCNFIFDIAYIRIKYPGSLYKFFRFRSLLEAMILSYFGLNKLIIKIIKIMIIAQEFEDFGDFILVQYTTIGDNRKLYFKNNKWIANPDPLSVIRGVLGSRVSLSKIQLDHMCSALTKVHIDNTIINNEYKTVVQLCRDKSWGKFSHWVYHTTHNFKNDTIAYQTDAMTAIENNFYGKDVLVINYYGSSKLSTQLLIKTNGLTFLSKEFKTPTIRVVEGLLRNEGSLLENELKLQGRYSESLLPESYANQIIDLKFNLNNFLVATESIDIDLCLKKEIFFKMVTYSTF